MVHHSKTGQLRLLEIKKKIDDNTNLPPDIKTSISILMEFIWDLQLRTICSWKQAGASEAKQGIEGASFDSAQAYFQRTSQPIRQLFPWGLGKGVLRVGIRTLYALNTWRILFLLE